jgi:hypothetical protein
VENIGVEVYIKQCQKKLSTEIFFYFIKNQLVTKSENRTVPGFLTDGISWYFSLG